MKEGIVARYFVWVGLLFVGALCGFRRELAVQVEFVEEVEVEVQVEFRLHKT